MSSRPISSYGRFSFARQPFKFIYTTFVLVTLLLHLVAIFLSYVPKFLRPNSRWSHHQAVSNKVFSVYQRYATAVEFRSAKPLDPRSGKEQRGVIDPERAFKLPSLTTKIPALHPGGQPKTTRHFLPRYKMESQPVPKFWIP